MRILFSCNVIYHGKFSLCYHFKINSFIITVSGKGNSKPLQHSCLENPMNRGACPTIVHGVARVGHDLVTKPPPSYLYCLTF